MRTVVKTYKFKLYKNKKNKYLDDDINIAAARLQQQYLQLGGQV